MNFESKALERRLRQVPSSENFSKRLEGKDVTHETRGV